MTEELQILFKFSPADRQIFHVFLLLLTTFDQFTSELKSLIELSLKKMPKNYQTKGNQAILFCSNDSNGFASEYNQRAAIEQIK